jgi:hypothetical protein
MSSTRFSVRSFDTQKYLDRVWDEKLAQSKPVLQFDVSENEHASNTDESRDQFRLVRILPVASEELLSRRLRADNRIAVHCGAVAVEALRRRKDGGAD